MEDHNKTILVVDDDTVVRRAVALLLKSAGYAVSEARDWAQASDELKAQRFDVILTDFRMSHVDEQDLEHIRRDQCPSTPIIALSSDPTASSQDGPSANARDWAFACFSKPIDARLLLFAVRSATAQQKSLELPVQQTPEGRAFYWKSGPSGTC